MTLSELSDILAGVEPQTYHLAAPADCVRYLVWHEYGMRLVRGDDRAQVRIPQVQIDAVCQDDDAAEGFFAAVLDALDDSDVPYSVQDISYDESLRALRCIIQCEVA